MRAELPKEGDLKGRISIPNKGCSQFRENIGPQRLEMFKEYAWKRQGKSGYTIYVNEANRTIMFEMSFYD